MCSAAPVKQGVKSSLLFIIILCILTLLFFILLIVFLIRYNRGDKYKVYEKEKRHGAKGSRLDEEDQFCEYVRRSVLPGVKVDVKPYCTMLCMLKLRSVFTRAAMHSTSGVCKFCWASNGTNLSGMMMCGG